MFARNALIALSLTLSTVAIPVLAQAETPKPVAAQAQNIEAELAKLKKAVGSGEISQKEYKTRKAALEASAQLAKADGK